MNEQDKEAFMKWHHELPLDCFDECKEAWHAALECRDEQHKDAVITYKAMYEQQRERSKKLVEHLEVLIDVTADDCRDDEDCDHCWAVQALKEYRGES